MTDDKVVEDEKYMGIGCDIPAKNLEHWSYSDHDFYNKILENVYRRQLIGNSGYITSQFEQISLTSLKWDNMDGGKKERERLIDV